MSTQYDIGMLDRTDRQRALAKLWEAVLLLAPLVLAQQMGRELERERCDELCKEQAEFALTRGSEEGAGYVMGAAQKIRVPQLDGFVDRLRGYREGVSKCDRCGIGIIGADLCAPCELAHRDDVIADLQAREAELRELLRGCLDEIDVPSGSRKRFRCYFGRLRTSKPEDEKCTRLGQFESDGPTFCEEHARVIRERGYQVDKLAVAECFIRAVELVGGPR